MAISKNFDELFLKPDHESEKWRDTLVYKAKNLSLNDFIDFTSDSKLYVLESQIFSAIQEFTKATMEEEEKYKMLKSLEEDDSVDNVDIKGSLVSIDTKDTHIFLQTLTGFLPFLKYDVDIENENRIGQCHTKSMAISQILNFYNEVVTGYVYGYADKEKYLHSWVETKLSNGSTIVIDYTINDSINF